MTITPKKLSDSELDELIADWKNSPHRVETMLYLFDILLADDLYHRARVKEMRDTLRKFLGDS